MAKSNQSYLFVEFAQTSATIAFEGTHTTLELHHDPNGRLTDEARETLKATITRCVGNRLSISAYCAIGVRGVSLRKLQLPPSKPENLRQMLSIQIEKEFPLGPDQLAWGFRRTNRTTSDSQQQEMLLVAVKKELVEDYKMVMTECGIESVFTVGALSLAQRAAGMSRGSFAILNGGVAQTEVVLCENGIPSTIRTLPVGSNEQVGELVHRLANVSLPNRVFLTGDLARNTDDLQTLKNTLGSDFQIEKLLNSESPGRSAVLGALQELVANNGTSELLTLQTGSAQIKRQKKVQSLPAKWIGFAAVLILGLVVLRYLDPMIKKPALAARIAEAREAQLVLPPIEQELDFLRYLESSRPAYINVVTILADAIPRGTKFEALTVDRRGGFSFRATLTNPQQATDLRAKLLASGLFRTVILEEQTPVENNRKLNVRIGARWKTDPKVPSKTIDRIVAESIKNSTNSASSKSKG